MGRGFATRRDVASFLRNASRDDYGTPNPLGTGIRRAYAAGGSQTGGYLRDYIYLASMRTNSAARCSTGSCLGSPAPTGSSSTSALPIRTLMRTRTFIMTTQNSYPPFTYAVTTDPVSGVHDGILKRPDTDRRSIRGLLFSACSAARIRDTCTIDVLLLIELP